MRRCRTSSGRPTPLLSCELLLLFLLLFLFCIWWFDVFALPFSVFDRELAYQDGGVQGLLRSFYALVSSGELKPLYATDMCLGVRLVSGGEYETSMADMCTNLDGLATHRVSA